MPPGETGMLGYWKTGMLEYPGADESSESVPSTLLPLVGSMRVLPPVAEALCASVPLVHVGGFTRMHDDAWPPHGWPTRLAPWFIQLAGWGLDQWSPEGIVPLCRCTALMCVPRVYVPDLSWMETVAACVRGRAWESAGSYLHRESREKKASRRGRTSRLLTPEARIE